MKKFFLLSVVCCLLLMLLISCNRLEDNSTSSNYTNRDELGLAYENLTAQNKLLYNASAENSAFMFYIYDGETVLSKIIFQSASHRQSIIDELSNIPAERVTGWTPDDITLPIYGIDMGTACGFGIKAAWSNGFWITQTGDVYLFDFDFEAFIGRQQWENPRNDISFAWFPNAIFLARVEEGWCETLLTPAAELNPPEGIEIALVSNTNEYVRLELTNNNDDYWLFGVHFRVDVLLGGGWYNIPTAPGGWVFVDIGLILEAGQTRVRTYSLDMYGELPPGTYRLVVHDMYVVFEVI